MDESTAVFTWALRTMLPKKKMSENNICFMIGLI